MDLTGVIIHSLCGKHGIDRVLARAEERNIETRMLFQGRLAHILYAVEVLNDNLSNSIVEEFEQQPNDFAIFYQHGHPKSMVGCFKTNVRLNGIIQNNNGNNNSNNT